MSPMLDLQKRAASKGRIRTGESVLDANGKQRPRSLTRFLITTDSALYAESIARVYGGTVKPWRPMGKDEQRGWGVLIDADELPVVVPPGGGAVSQWWEMWSAAGLQRRCDGETVSVWGVDDKGKGTGERRGPCLCPADLMDRAGAASGNRPTACHASTRVTLMLPDVPGTGTFMVESHGLSAAQEMSGVATAMVKALEAGVMLPALLRLEQREGVRRPGEVTNRFVVPVLDLVHTPRQLMELAANPPAGMLLPPAPPGVALLESGQPGTPGGTEAAVPAIGGPSGPQDAQALYEAAVACTSLEVLTSLATLARDRDWMGTVVEVEPDLFEALGPVLLGLREKLA